MSVSWRRQSQGSDSRGQVAPAGKTSEARGSDTVKGSMQRFGRLTIHSVRFTGLRPATAYEYRVSDGAAWSEWRRFTTAAKDKAPMAFLYFGDAQTGFESHWAKAVRVGLEKAPDARFVVYAGDLVNDGGSHADWNGWFDAAAPLLAAVPGLPAPGDHEYASWLGFGRRLTPYWTAQFDLPRNGPKGLAGSSYYIDVQGVRIAVLNSSEPTREQAAWLDGVLASNPNSWSVLVLHHPVLTSAKGRNNKGRQAFWQPVIDKHNADLVLQGHDHVYTRSGLIRGDDATSSEGAGTVYVTAVAGSKTYEVQRKPWMRRIVENTPSMQAIRVNGDRLSFEAWSLERKLIDAFEIVKIDRAKKRLADRTLEGQPHRESAAGRASPQASGSRTGAFHEGKLPAR